MYERVNFSAFEETNKYFTICLNNICEVKTKKAVVCDVQTYLEILN